MPAAANASEEGGRSSINRPSRDSGLASNIFYIYLSAGSRSILDGYTRENLQINAPLAGLQRSSRPLGRQPGEGAMSHRIRSFAPQPDWAPGLAPVMGPGSA